MKNNFIYIVILLATFATSCQAQAPQISAVANTTNVSIADTVKIEWKLLNKVSLTEADKLSIDPYSSVYVSDHSGNIRRYDSTGVLQLTYSPTKKGQVTLLESWRYVNTFVYFRNFQTYLILDRFLNSTSSLAIDNANIGFARLATFSQDNNLWIVDEGDFSLIKFNTTFNKVELKTNLDLLLDPELYDLTFMREYQNLVFLSDKNSGILIFDNLGNYKNKISAKDLEYFSFNGDELVYIQDGKLKLYDIYKARERSVRLPEGIKPSYVVMSNTRIFFLTPTQLFIYQAPKF